MDLSIVVGDYRYTTDIRQNGAEGSGVALRPAIVDPVYKAFHPMIVSQPYDLCEMALVAYLQAHEAGRPLMLLPLVMMGGAHYGSLWTRRGGEVSSPSDLTGGRVGVRSYSQTTGMWVRAILWHEFGVNCDDVTWVTEEGSHEPRFNDPDNVVRAQEGKTLVEMVEKGAVDAVILSAEAGEAAGLRPVVPDAAERGLAWWRTHGTAPINHMLVVRADLIQAQEVIVAGAFHLIKSAVVGSVPNRANGPTPDRGAPSSAGTSDLSTIETIIAEAIGFSLEQHLIARQVRPEELFAHCSDGSVLGG